MGQGRRCNPFRPVRRSLFSLKFPGPPLIHTALWHGSHVKVQHNIHLPVSVHCGQAWCSNSDLWNADEVNAEKLWVADSAGELPCFFYTVPICMTFRWRKKNRLTHVAYHWQQWEFRLPITDCCLPCARPQRPLLSLDPQTAPGRAAGMDCNGMHYSADRGRTFKSGAEFFIPWYVLIA